MLQGIIQIVEGTSFLITGATINLLQLGLLVLWPITPLQPVLNKCMTSLNKLPLALICHSIGLDNCVFYASNDDAKHFGKESTFNIANHRHHADFLYVILYAEAMGMLENSKVFLKSNLIFAPVVGALNYFAGSCFLKRNLEKDKETIKNYVENLVKADRDSVSGVKFTDKFLFLIFGEGTRITQEKQDYSNSVAVEKFGAKPLKHLLHPRPSGYFMLLEGAKMAPIPTYMISIRIIDNDGKISKNGPSLLNVFGGHQSGKIHFQIKRFANVHEDILDENTEIPDKKKCTKFLNSEWEKMDNDIEFLIQNGKYPLPVQNLMNSNKMSTLKYLYGTSIIWSMSVLSFSVGKISEFLPIWGWGVVFVCAVCFVKYLSFMSDPANSSKATIKKKV